MSLANAAIRNAKLADLPAIVDIYNATIPCHSVTGDLEPISVKSRMAWFHAHSPDRYPLWVMEHSSEVVGWLGFQPFYGRPAYQATSELSLYVNSAHRRRGIGRQLLQQAIQRSPSLGIKTLLGFIFEHNAPSLCLFEQMGFQRWGFLPQVAQFGSEERGLVIVGLRVASSPKHNL